MPFSPFSPIATTLLATAVAGLGSVLLAAFLLRRARALSTDFLLSFAAGALLATAFSHLLPEALEEAVAHGSSVHGLFLTLFAALLAFFLLNKAELYHHGHDHGHSHDEAHSHAHGHHHSHEHGQNKLSLLLGDSVHCIGDGMLIAAACLSNPTLGWLVALAVFAHEVPHHIGDLVVLKGQKNMRPALLKLLSAGSATILGGVLGLLFLSRLEGLMPYMLIIASGSFIYVALADLIPQLQRRWSRTDTLQQISGLSFGAALVLLAAALATHGH